jgi:HK97 gp10 family phage protein
MGKFAAQVSKWARESERRMVAIMRESAQRVIEEANRPRAKGGRMPVDTGFLRSSGVASLSSMPPIRADAVPGSAARYDAGDAYSLTISGWDGEQPLYYGWTAAYAAYVEYGTERMRPAAFMRSAAAQWQRIVREVEREAKARAGG